MESSPEDFASSKKKPSYNSVPYHSTWGNQKCIIPRGIRELFFLLLWEARANISAACSVPSSNVEDWKVA